MCVFEVSLLVGIIRLRAGDGGGSIELSHQSPSFQKSTLDYCSKMRKERMNALFL